MGGWLSSWQHTTSLERTLWWAAHSVPSTGRKWTKLRPSFWRSLGGKGPTETPSVQCSQLWSHWVSSGITTACWGEYSREPLQQHTAIPIPRSVVREEVEQATTACVWASSCLTVVVTADIGRDLLKALITRIIAGAHEIWQVKSNSSSVSPDVLAGSTPAAAEPAWGPPCTVHPPGYHSDCTQRSSCQDRWLEESHSPD